MDTQKQKAGTDGRTFGALAEPANVGDEARGLVDPESAPETYLPLLVENGHLHDAIRLLAALLPPREAVWWGWVCARKAVGDDPAPEVETALGAIERWLREPTDQHRRAALAAGEAADLATPIGCVAMAAFFSGGSIAPPDVDPVPPPPFIAGRTLATGIMISAVVKDPEQAPEKLQAFVEQGMHVAKRVGVLAG